MDYSKLRDLLKEGKWREAEDETRELLIQAAGKGAVKRGWVYFSEVKFIPGERGFLVLSLLEFTSQDLERLGVPPQRGIRSRQPAARPQPASGWLQPRLLGSRNKK